MKKNTTYTAEDFANAEIARHPDGAVASRFGYLSQRQWRTVNAWLSDADMADQGWVPVREAAAQPITLNALRDAWEGAEVVTEDEPIREGDLLIEQHPAENGKAWIVFEANQAWAGDYQGPSIRILHRAPKPKRPEGAERLEALLDEWHNAPLRHDDKGLADWLAERGVRVTEEGEK